MPLVVLAFLLTLAPGTNGTKRTPRAYEPEWSSVVAEYYRPGDCRRGEGERRECKRILLQFGAISVKRADNDATLPSGGPVSAFVAPAHPEAPKVILHFEKQWCKPIPGDPRGLWVCTAPKSRPYGIWWTPVTTQTTETK